MKRGILPISCMVAGHCQSEEGAGALRVHALHGGRRVLLGQRNHAGDHGRPREQDVLSRERLPR